MSADRSPYESRLWKTPVIRLTAQLSRVLLISIAATGVILEHGFYQPVLSPWLTPLMAVWSIRVIEILFIGLYIGDYLWRQKTNRQPLPDQRITRIDWFLWIITTLGMIAHLISKIPWTWWVFEAMVIVLLLRTLWRTNVLLSRWLSRPGLLLPLSFATLIALGTPLLMLPVAVPQGQNIKWLEAFFTMTSAVCVTGLTVRDTASQFTPFGQLVIGLFIQLGGLGIIIFGSMLALLLGRGLSLRESKNLSQMLNDQPMERLQTLVWLTVLSTLVFELLGAAAMMPLWDGNRSFFQRLSMSLFHSVSAFCNAGFDITGKSLVDYRYTPLVHLVIFPLIVIGGLGFPVLDNMLGVIKHRLRRWIRPSGILTANVSAPLNLNRQRLNLHSKIVLTTTVGLYLYGVVFIAAGQLAPYLYEQLGWGVTANVVRPQPLTLQTLGTVMTDASFMSITSRTAGFNAMPMEELRPAGQFVVMTLMMIGGSPGGTAGGVKTITFALLLLSILATIRQRNQVETFSRTIADALVRKAATIAICLVGLVCASTLLLCISEPFPFIKIIFESVSAATTTGLSLGITGELTWFGKVVMILTMFLGRVGPLALLGAITFAKHTAHPYAYPHEGVVLG